MSGLPKQIILATRNRDKVLEIKALLRDLPIEIRSLADLSELEIEEDQDTIQGNAEKKARRLFESFHIPSLADDTGLEVDALGGAPGVYSARYAGDKASYEENVDKLLKELSGVPLEQRTARFRTVMAFAYEGGILFSEGVCEGLILFERRGNGGFGYDPVFYYPPLQKTFAELTLEEKNSVSHRSIALQNMKMLLNRLYGA
ncbi:MAG: RdgB/HAM1 family non-canonical purine NTP pyrophosphatase [candidate division KSB1 bacterium]|nr:RdgB/HAM1 family non-canonical purine NTP pyrophosphatase [candidate division KSB1 bacterium]